MIVHLITMWIAFFFHRRKEGMYKINIKQSQSQFFWPFRQEAAIERLSMERHSCRMCRVFFFHENTVHYYAVVVSFEY